jgi:hypothetical protein
MDNNYDSCASFHQTNPYLIPGFEPWFRSLNFRPLDQLVVKMVLQLIFLINDIVCSLVILTIISAFYQSLNFQSAQTSIVGPWSATEKPSKDLFF